MAADESALPEPRSEVAAAHSADLTDCPATVCPARSWGLLFIGWRREWVGSSIISRSQFSWTPAYIIHIYFSPRVGMVVIDIQGMETIGNVRVVYFIRGYRKSGHIPCRDSTGAEKHDTGRGKGSCSSLPSC